MSAPPVLRWQRGAGQILALLVGLTAGCGEVPFRAEAPIQAPKDGLAPTEPVAFSPDDDLTGSATADGRYVVYVSQQNGNLDVWVRDYGRNSNFPITLNPADDFDPALSPDGQRLVFVSRRRDAKGDLYLSSGLGAETDPEPLTDDRALERQPVFAPDGNTLYYTAAFGIGAEQIWSLRLEDRAAQPVSKTPGFDPAISSDGRYLIYTAPASGSFVHPHLVAQRLSDSATRALSKGEVPEGFSRFLDARTLAFVRFADDDNQDGLLDANDQASLWRVPLDLDRWFSGPNEPLRPEPLTHGADDELFPSAAAGHLYFTQGTRQQDVVRLPITGLFPEYPAPADYFELVRTLDDPRTKVFALRKAAARAIPGSRVEAEAQLQTGRIFQSQGRPELAARAYRQVVEAPPTEDRSVLVGLAEAELLSLEREERYTQATTPEARRRVLESSRQAGSALKARHLERAAVVARIELELAELIYLGGDRPGAIVALEALVSGHPSQTDTAARASVRRIELLGIAHDPDALGEAYAQVIRSFPEEREVVREAARRLVSAHLLDLAKGEGWRAEVDVLRRLIPRYGKSPVRTEARARLAQVLREHKAYGDTALELEEILREETEDRYVMARNLLALAEVEEAQGAYDRAIQAWSKVRARFGDLPGYAAQSRQALTRLNLLQAEALEQKGDREAARLAYRSVIDNDLTQARAHRRYLAISAETGHLEEAVEEAANRAEAQPATPIARYAYGLALSYADPPDYDRALEEIEESIRLNPQFTYAYITRGWMREMAELEEPGIFAQIGRTLVDTLRVMVGGALDVPIGQSGPLESAIEDYKTALSLNQESVSPETESEILLDLGNAQYRLAEQTKDASNMRGAFERYLEALQLGTPFESPVAELVFWERFGRAAIWLEDYAIATMATRRAIELATEAKVPSRLAQLYGNLALAYGQAGEEAYAQGALEHFQEELKRRELEEKLVVSLRDLAFSQLAKAPMNPEELTEALSKLQASRESLSKIEETDRGELPTAWRSLGNDATRAQYGFSKAAELDLNLALAESAHQLLGERGRVEQLRVEREVLTSELLADPEESLCLFFGFALCVVKVEPLVLGQLRERLGLLTARARAAHERGDWSGAQVALQNADEELETWIADERLPKDGLALALDRGRLLALWAELALQAPPNAGANLNELSRRLDQALAGIGATTQTATTAGPPADADLAELSALTSSTAVEALKARALSLPRLPKLRLEVRRVQARLLHVKGLVALAKPDRGSSGQELREMLLGLDSQIEVLMAARREFELAALHAATAGPGLGARGLALSLAQIAEIDRRLGRPDLGVRSAALALAKETGDLPLYERLWLLAGQARDPAQRSGAQERLHQAYPQHLGASVALVTELAARSASTALGAGDLEGAFKAVDRWLLLAGAQGGRQRWSESTPALPRSGSEVDRLYLEALTQRLRSLDEARHTLDLLDDATAPEDFAGALARAQNARQAVQAWLEKPELSDRAAARHLARSPLDLEGIGYELGPKEGLVVYAPILGELHGLYVDGSTTAEPKVRRFKVPGSAQGVLDDLAALESELVSGLNPSSDRTAALKAKLFGELTDALAGKEVLMVAGALIGGPLPAQVHPQGVAVVHLTAPSLLALLRSGQLVGLSGQVALGPVSEALFEADQRLEADQALSLARSIKAKKLEPGELRDLDQLPLAQKLLDRAKDQILIDAELQLEPGALERSALLVREVVEPTEGQQNSERYAHELALEDLNLPARVYVFGRARGPRRALYGLDLTLLGQGVASTLVYPAQLAPEVVRRIHQRFTETEALKGPALALMAAVAPELANTPMAGLITLLGAPGLDRAGTKLWAESKLPEARTQALNAVNKRQFREAVPRLERWIRLQRLAGKEEQIEIAYGALVGIFRERLEPPQPIRGIEAQQALLEYLESKKKPGRKVIDAQIDLALLYGLAQDYPKGEALFEASLKALEPLDDAEGLARAYFKYGRFKKDAREYEASARLMEQAIQRYSAVGAYERPKVPAKKGDPVYPLEAELALAQVGDTYLNALSDPDRARRAYERAKKWAKTEEDRIATEIDLARVGRRAGDFASAQAHAEGAVSEANKANLKDLLLSAVIEAANVAWYQGNYRQGGVLCQQSLDLADQLIELQKKEAALPAPKPGTPAPKKLNPRVLQNGKIYALSVCGLVAMSQRNFEQAKAHLERAKRIAAKLGGQGEIAASRLTSDREVATQFNNLGRVYLEFGRVEEAIDAFMAAKSIDERLGDRYALAYDLRNLGGAFAFKKDWARAEETLGQGLEFARAVRDTNNELRARFTLAEVAVGSGNRAVARQRYRDALPLAERLGVQELAWQIHRGLGLLARAEGQDQEAEAELRHAIRIARSITGRSAPSEFGPGRYAAFDDLLVLLAQAGRIEEAFEVANDARALEQVELLEDDRIVWSNPGTLEVLERVRRAATSSAAASERERLAAIEPRLGALLAPAQVSALSQGLPADAGMIVYRTLPDRILAFALDARGIQLFEAPVDSAELRALLAEYGRRMSLRSEPTAVHQRLAELLVKPVAGWLEGKQRLAIVAHQGLRYVAFGALPMGGEGGEALLDRLVLIQAIHPTAARNALLDRQPLSLAEIVALGGVVAPVGSSDPPLPFSEREVRTIAEEHPQAQVSIGAAVTRQALLTALGEVQGVLHFAGHSFLTGPDPRGRFVDPLGGQLRTSDGPITMLEVLGTRTQAELVVLSACSSAIWPRRSSGSSGADELLSMAQTFQLSGAHRVLGTTVHVHDLAASLVMKHFYRAARQKDVASALREAQLKVRKSYPHPSWWASFVLYGG
ncbi:MAG: CHAT domain-containing protein [Deltaproteobacteria bacterium]|nr:CHAT domain-containing protein [Deltaproteobacteria bacterium]